MNDYSANAASRFLALSNLLSNEVPSGDRPVPLEGVHLHQALQQLDYDLPPFLRTLLVADGTVTMAIEAYYSESVDVKTMNQSQVKLPLALPMLAIDSETDVLYREVILRGHDSGRIYASAYSMIRKSIIPDNLYQALVEERVGIGTLLRNTAKGSYREILRIRAGGVTEEGDPFVFEPSGVTCTNDISKGLVSRTYCVYLDTAPGILITEVFPISPYLSATIEENSK